MKEFLAVRPEVQKFAQMMERKLRKHDAKLGSRVEGFDGDFCVGRLEEEFKELMAVWAEYQESHRAKDFDRLCRRVHQEAVDVANFCMMLCLS